MFTLPWYLGNSRWIVPLALWSVVWQGLALWHAAGRREKWWFIVFLFVHTAGILEIIYLAFVVKLFSGKKYLSKAKKR